MRAGGLLVTHVENLIARAEIILRRAMAVQAPLHLQGGLLIHERHLVDWAVAGVASHALVDMNAVIEKSEVGKLVHAGPLQRFAGAVAGADGFEQLGVRPDLRVAVHTRAGGRNAGEARRLNRSVTVAAVNAQPRNVVLMTKRHRLRLADAGVGGVGRALDLHGPPSERRKHGNRAQKSRTGQCGWTVVAEI